MISKLTKRILFFLLFISLLSFADIIKIATYNIRAGKGIDNKYNLLRIKKFIKNENIDIIGIQEVDCKTRRRNYDNQPKILSGKTFYYFYSPTIFYNGGLYGILLLSKYSMPYKKDFFLFQEKGFEPRKVQHIIVKVKNRYLHIFNTHLSYKSKKMRIKGIKEILSEMPDKNTVLLGDFNTTPHSEVIKLIEKAGFISLCKYFKKEIKTYPANNPSKKIDYIFVSRDLIKNVKKIYTKNLPYSDHIPLISIFEF